MKYLRRYPFKNAYNIRDLGGYPTNNEGTTRFGILYRADSLANLSLEEWKDIEQMQVKTIIDLRSIKEKISKSYLPSQSINYFHMPLQDEKHKNDILENAIHKYNTDNEFEQSMSEAYTELFKNNTSNIVQILKTIASTLENGSVLFHCTAGKDRTGIIAALILYLCNVNLVDISADYQISYTYNQKNPIIQEVVQLYGNLLRSDPDNIESLIFFLKTLDIKKILHSKGFTDNELIKVKNHFILMDRKDNI